MQDTMPMWTVFVTYSEPMYPAGVQRVGKRQGITVSVRAADGVTALARGAECAKCAKRKGCKRCKGMWSVKMEGV